MSQAEKNSGACPASTPTALNERQTSARLCSAVPWPEYEVVTTRPASKFLANVGTNSEPKDESWPFKERALQHAQARSSSKELGPSGSEATPGEETRAPPERGFFARG
eukprot:9183710-Alexandrium_andersonii.AAC.1